ncbi:MAG: DUF4906 domain-containing protein [Alistipes sp.]|nr:DUF4906 domain-containing protein [Alistipes sp.]
MKKIYRISSFVLALALCALTACTKTEIDDVVMVPDGSSARVALNFNVKSSIDVTTRAAQPEYYEYLVNNIYVLIFNGNQRIELSENANDPNGNVNFFSPEEIKDYQNRLDDAGSAESSGTIEFGAISGAGLKICAVANLGVSNSMTRADFDEDAITKDLNKFDAIKTYDEFKKMSIDLRSHSIMRLASFLMTGEKDDVTLNAYTGKESEITTITIPLERTDSKITFNVKAANDKLTDFEFVPLKWRVVNVPTVSYVLPRIENSAASTTLTENLDATVDNVTADFFSIPAEEAILFEGKVQEGETSVDNSGTFTFYMYENLKTPQKNIEGSDAAAYALREKQVKTATSSGVTGQRFENGDYEYAPKGATYVVFTGQVSYTETDEETKQDRFVLADVEYSVHLGHGSNTNVNSYNTLRNHHYTYNVTVTGINDLLVEVESNNPSEGEPTDDERRPGAEGDIVMSASQIVEVDGHYDRALITLTAEEANKIFFAISTPWERGLDTNGFLEANNTTMRDYKWVKFLIHTNLGIAEGNLAAYPGEQCYDGGKTNTGTAANSPAYGKDVTLRDIRQLSNYFKDENNKLDPNETVTITMFIDEYLYYYDPTSDPVTTPAETTYKGVTDLTSTNDKGLLLWKKSVNNEPRLMHIVKAGDMAYSADGETSLSRSVVTIKQKPIISLYNTSASDEFLKSAWGTETVNETPRLGVSRNSYPTQSNTTYAYSYSNARTQLAGTTATLNWSSVISSNAANRYELLDSYTDPSYACAMRNRDLDGDGLIDPNEVLWYLAAIDQITDLWIADPIMPNDAKLFDPNNPDGTFNDRDADGVKTAGTHYISSTMLTISNSNNDNPSPRIYWAEEYGATSTYAQSTEWQKAPGRNENGSVVSVRCLRNMGMPYGSTTMPQDYIVVKQPEDGIVTREDITDEVLADGEATPNEYDEYTRTAQNVSKDEYLGPNEDDDNYSWSNNNRKSNDYGYVEREYQWSWGGVYYNYTYYNYIYTYYRVTDTSVDGSITLPYINKGALRSSFDNETSLPYAHIDDIGENNRPYTGLFVLNTPVEAKWRDLYDSERSTTNKICPAGYRVPNQREMILMTRAITSWPSGAYGMLNGQYIYGRTSYNFGEFYYYTAGTRISRRTSTTTNTNSPVSEQVSGGRGPDSSTGRVRCVKDNPNAKHSSSSDFNEGGEG